MGDYGVGECAGEVISRTDMDLSVAESTVFEATVSLDEDDLARADERAYSAMVSAARGVLALRVPNPPVDTGALVDAFHETAIEGDWFAGIPGGRFANSLVQRHAKGPAGGADAVRELVEEAQLFIDAAHQFQIRVAAEAPTEVSA